MSLILVLKVSNCIGIKIVWNFLMWLKSIFFSFSKSSLKYPFTKNTHYMNFSHVKIWFLSWAISILSLKKQQRKNVYKLSYERNFNFFNDLGGGVLTWVNDGFCDDMNNNEACNYDDGDCCGTLANKKFCRNCQCLSK